jgi:hypothetical protein
MRTSRPSTRYAVVLWAACIGMSAARAGGDTELYVAADQAPKRSSGRRSQVSVGHANPGTKENPLPSLEAARDAIRNLRKSGSPLGPTTVWIRGGVYRRTQTFCLTQEDSGSKDAPIVYRAYGDEKVRLVGGREIEPAWLTPVVDTAVLARLPSSARGKVLQVDLRAHGVSDFGELGSLGGGLKLFCGGRRLPLARWPNQGWALARRGKVIGKDETGVPQLADEGREGKTLGFQYQGDPPNSWLAAKGIWLRGYWQQEYSFDGWQPVGVDTRRQEITLGWGAGDHLADWRRFYAINLLEEIDRPGEWFLDHRRGILYLLPPEGFPDHPLMYSVLSQTMISLQNTSYVTIRGLTLEVMRGVAAQIEGGTHNRIAGCTIRHAHQGVILSGGTKNGVLGCDIYDLDSMGIRLSGGDRATLTPAGLYAVNNHLHHYAQCYKTWHPGVKVQGVGNRVAHNRIDHAPQYAISYEGNDHLIELNDLHDLCLEMSDVGVIGCGGDWTFRGNVVRHNFIHHIPKRPYPGVAGVYLDDCVSSTRVFGNVFYRLDKAVLIGGGRDHVVENNVFIECETPVHFDNRGLRWDHFRPGGPMYQKLEAVPYRKPPWSTRYPELARILAEIPQAPLGNVLARNLSYRSGWRDPKEVCRKVFANHVDRKYMTITDNLVTQEDPGFVDAARMDFRLRDDSTVYRCISGFQRIPFEKIGLYRDEYRATWPPSAAGWRHHAAAARPQNSSGDSDKSVTG